MLVTDADDRMPESRRVRLHRIPAMLQRRISIFCRNFLSRYFKSSGAIASISRASRPGWLSSGLAVDVGWASVATGTGYFSSFMIVIICLTFSDILECRTVVEDGGVFLRSYQFHQNLGNVRHASARAPKSL